MPAVSEEEFHFIASESYFFIYGGGTWKCLRTGAEVHKDVKEVKRTGQLYTSIPYERGVIGSTDSMDTILDLFNSGQYLEWMRQNRK